jgi:hypothetical protein
MQRSLYLQLIFHSSDFVPYLVNEVRLNNSRLVSDLGVLVDTKLAYFQHINSFKDKAIPNVPVSSFEVLFLAT